MRGVSRRWHRSALLILLGAFQCAWPIFPPPIRPTVGRPPTAAELAELWVEPEDASRRDLFHGIGGEAQAPDPHARYQLISEKHDFFSSSRGYKVRDPSGIEWSVKLGPEAQPEVVASRLIWAVGYHQPPVYYVERWQLEKDGETTAQPPARFRPKLPIGKRRGGWSWQQNPFVGTRQYRALIVLMLMLNNWDLTTANNTIYDLRTPWDGTRRWYVVRDVGAAFSRIRGIWFQGARGDLEGFARGAFIDSVHDGHVVFAWNGPRRELIRDITVADVHWIAERLARLTATQWDDALRAGGYSGADARLIRRTLDERIAQARTL